MTLTTDVLVVGSGASAAPLAFSLAQQKVKVMVLEKGDWCPYDAFREDELAQHHLEMYRPSGEVDPSVIYSQGKLISESSRVGQAFYLVGGGTVRYSATSWRFRPKDFRKLSDNAGFRFPNGRSHASTEEGRKNMTLDLTRRLFLINAAAFSAGISLTRQVGAKGTTAAKHVRNALLPMSPPEWRVLELTMDEIIPKTEWGPSASEAGVKTYLERFLGLRLPHFKFLPARYRGSSLRQHYSELVTRLDRASMESNKRKFVELTPAERSALLRTFSSGSSTDVGYRVTGLSNAKDASDMELFDLFRRHVLQGYFSDPHHGGNKNFTAWEAIGHTTHVRYTK